MSAARGWCPSLHEPMASGDGALVRIKPPLGQLSAAQARALAAAAAAHGNGAIDLTSRGALQVRGLDAAGAGRFAAAVVGLGLGVADPAAERRRTVLVPPLAGCDPAVAPGTIELALALEAAIVRDEGLAGLPAKFRFAVDGGGALPIADGADVVVGVAPGAVALALRAAHGRLGAPSGGARGTAEGGASGAIGRLAGGRAFGAGVRFGRLDAALLAALADVAARQGDGVVRLTPWRAVAIAGLRDGSRLAALGLIVSAADPALRVAACPGRPGCASASVDTRVLAGALAAQVRPGVAVHVSGCSKGCAHPGAAAVTLVGREGRFDLVRDGRAGDRPVRRGLTPADLAGVR